MNDMIFNGGIRQTIPRQEIILVERINDFNCGIARCRPCVLKCVAC
jgi:hypothetical protein